MLDQKELLCLLQLASPILPVGVGFGISDPTQALQVKKWGSSLLGMVR